MVVCADCGNNCCNAGTSEINGVRCGCAEAYEHQSAYWKDKTSVKFAKDDRKDPSKEEPTPEEARAYVASFFEKLKPSE